jgi:hypothetical protein
MAACCLRLVRDLGSAAAWEGGRVSVSKQRSWILNAGDLDDLPLPTFMPPRKTGTILLLVSEELTCDHHREGGWIGHAAGIVRPLKLLKMAYKKEHAMISAGACRSDNVGGIAGLFQGWVVAP